jgi:dihydroxyacetone kinase
VTRLFNDPADFADESAVGFAAAYGRWVRQVPGGMVRATRGPNPTVAVVIGGGSGHYPAFAGYVGQGIAHGAVMGNLFASPSANQVQSVARAAQQGRGVLLGFGNYAGDVLHFGEAADALNAAGIPTKVIAVTDDVSSASVDEVQKRRGIAGDVVVFKIAGAAAEAGHDLDRVAELAGRANDRTRSYGVAFSGCSLPGAPAPLFEVPAGRVALGLGIHGEPGIGEQAIPTADELAELLVRDLLAELPAGVTAVAGQRAAVILNGLGSVKYEEMFVVYRKVAALLDGAGVTIVDPEVGELVTSFDMAGLSLTICWLDDELEQLWTAPADTPAVRKGNTAGDQQAVEVSVAATEVVTYPPTTAESQLVSKVVGKALAAIRATVDEHADELGRIDAVAGDGDHGIGMQRGSRAAYAAAQQAVAAGAGAGTVLAVAADAWADRAGGTSGALWGLILRTLGKRIGDEVTPDAATVALGVDEAVAAVVSFGKAQVGDKTMVDVLVPFSAALTTAARDGADSRSAWRAATLRAEEAANQTAGLRPKIGRARPHAERSLGTPDAGAVSSALIARAVATSLFTQDAVEAER